MRYVAPNKRVVDENAVRGGPGPGAFKLTPEDEGGLSVTEIEHFGANDAPTRVIAAVAFRASIPSKKLGANGLFARATVGAVKSAAAGYKKSVRVVHDPVEGNPGHAEIRHFDDNDFDLLAFFATDVFVDYEVVSAMGIPPA
ncbi:MAG: hypothetical protein E7773_00695 [Sphingomonas sp.]|uniref:hypothetical protein n=1 Tax=Sphingomonas sp. TaxID=28214 RepID=UPI001210652A|nr:hypothetical protein [Sphingomonas sp.]THD38305.1 MAG: hypothetical protein E7773_00695 [Sphingomonas sp.]